MRNFKNFSRLAVLGFSALAFSGCGKAPISGTFVGQEKLTMNQNTNLGGTTGTAGQTAATSNTFSTYLTLTEGQAGAIKGVWISSGSGTYNLTGTTGTDRIDGVSMTLDGATANTTGGNNSYGYGTGMGSYGYNAYSNCTYQGTLFLDKDTLKGELIANSQYCPALTRSIEAKRSQSN